MVATVKRGIIPEVFKQPKKLQQKTDPPWSGIMVSFPSVRFNHVSLYLINLANNSIITKKSGGITESHFLSRRHNRRKKIRSWYAEIAKHVAGSVYEEVMLDPKQIYNMGETAFHLTPKSGQIITKKGAKSFHFYIGNDDKECLTVLEWCPHQWFSICNEEYRIQL